MNPLSSGKALIDAVHNSLQGSVEVQAALGKPARLYDHAPEDPIFPYLSYGAMRSTDMSADETRLSAHSLNLHIWSRYFGRTEAVNILSAVAKQLESGSLDLTDARLISANVVYTDIFRAPDGRTIHGILRINFTIQSDLETAI